MVAEGIEATDAEVVGGQDRPNRLVSPGGVQARVRHGRLGRMLKDAPRVALICKMANSIFGETFQALGNERPGCDSAYVLGCRMELPQSGANLQQHWRQGAGDSRYSAEDVPASHLAWLCITVLSTLARGKADVAVMSQRACRAWYAIGVGDRIVVVEQSNYSSSAGGYYRIESS